MLKKIQKRNGEIVNFDKSKIYQAILLAVTAVCKEQGQEIDESPIEKLTQDVINISNETLNNVIPTVEDIQDIVEKVLIENGHSKVAKAYILYRKNRSEIREVKNMFMDSEKVIESYINLEDWRVNENANMSYSLQGLNNHIVDAITSNYWLNKVYGKEITKLHKNGDIHLHDLNLLAPYCMGHDLEALLLKGFKGAKGKIESKPAKHFDTALMQIVNYLYTLQGESAGANAFSSIDTYLAPFIYYDNLKYEEIKKSLQMFIFNLNIPTRVGFQCPFSNITLDIKVHKLLKDKQVIIGGRRMNSTYKEFQREMDLFNLAFCEIMLEGDGSGRMFSFPIPTINITNDFDWNSGVTNKIMELTQKFGSPYFSNFINSDLKPEDTRSMCCRLKLDITELKKRGGGLFGANPKTGSIQVVTLNMARLGYTSKTKQEFLEKIYNLMEIGREVCERKRKILENYMQAGLYPYSRYYLQDVKDITGEYFKNHFSTIGLNGMNEACINLLGKNIATKEGQEFAIEVMEFMNHAIKIFQAETGNLYNLEASPAEGATYRFARIDKKLYPNIVTQGDKVPYYTNSTQLPVDCTEDIFDAIEHQEELQSLYTGGTVLHGFIGEKIDNIGIVKQVIQKAFKNSKIPYLTITPTFSICENHGYLIGEQPKCPSCGKETEIWSRVVGFHRPVSSWNKGKQEEYKDRKVFKI